MGQEIDVSHFKKQDFIRFGTRLREETEILAALCREHALSEQHGWAGFELEAWLVDEHFNPNPVNEALLARMDDALVSPELSQFNVELNSTPRCLTGDALRRMEDELSANWGRLAEAARGLASEVVMIGILPTVQEEMLTLQHMSLMERYRALNEQVMRLRKGKPLSLDIQGMEHLHTVHHDVMLESATTSFQVHLQVAQDKAVRYYNALQILSAPMVAISSNSPYLFGKRLWRETRIPLFEQAVDIGGIADAAFGPLKRVTFGSGYARHSLLEIFEENLEHYPLLLPVELDRDPQRLSHLRLHNGTIWRWNRPLVDFDANGKVHMRIEHRVMPSGPSVIDTIANLALLQGAVRILAEQEQPPESLLEFARARENFYSAAKHGLKASVSWLDGRNGPVAELLEKVLLPMAGQGLEQLGCDESDIQRYLGVIAGRLATGQTGAVWQTRYREQHDGSFAELVAAYQRRQNSGQPVHNWTV